MAETKLQTIALVGSYPPRKCGIATFSKDLFDHVAKGDVRGSVLAMDDTDEGYDYPPEVRFEIRPNELKDYELATDYLNINQMDVVLVQHEYGLFGARAGENIVSLVRNTRMPVITTLHTILDKPNREQALVMQELLTHSDRVVVMSRRGRDILRSVYEADDAKIAHIPHGVPDLSFVDPSFYKDRFGFAGRKVLMTFGLLSPGKGIETVIAALPDIVKKNPEVLYVIVGAMHPHVERRQGHAYLQSLERQAERLGVADHILFHTRFVSLPELCAYLGAADIYVVPYPHKHQITSGTLSYAMGAGKAVVSTPFYYAEEMLAEGRGKLFDFGNSGQLARTVLELLENPTQMDAMRKSAYTFARNMIWPEVGEAYRKLAAEVIAERHHSPRQIAAPTASSRRATSLPEIRIRHLVALSDETGILQHADYSIPNRDHGYCVDDNARALIAAMRYWELTEDEQVLPLARRYLGFLMHAYDPKLKRFRNFMSYDRRWLEPADYSDDALGRSILALGTTAAFAPGDDLRIPAVRRFGDALPGVESMTSPRGWAFAALGIQAYLKHFSGDSFARRMREILVRRLDGLLQQVATPEWNWFENILTYDNAVMPHALINCGQCIGDSTLVQRGLDSLEWLLNIQTDDTGQLMLVGNTGWYPKNGAAAKFDQQPIDAMTLVMACCEAFRVTSSEIWRDRARNCFDWFLGANCVRADLYDAATGGCRDGLGANGPNANEGAESTLAWLIALMGMHKAQREEYFAGEGERTDSLIETGMNGEK